ncbi:MAG: hypothetical protein F6J96_30085 [Symploca sp. SIO1C2]|nr:hypothetical protein [Symploca sp. SIO1C2]
MKVLRIIWLIWLVLLLNLTACQAQQWAHELAVNPDYRGSICLYIGSWKGDLTFNITSGALNYQFDIRNSHYNDKKAFEFLARGNQGSQLYLSYLPTPAKPFSDSPRTVYTVSINPKLYYDSCEVVAPKTVLNFSLWQIYDLDNRNFGQFQADPEILTWSILCVLVLLGLSGILSLLIGFRTISYEVLKLWSLHTTTKVIDLSLLPELTIGQQQYCQIQGQITQVKRNREDNLPLAVKVQVGTETVVVMLKGIEIISPISLSVHLWSIKSVVFRPLETLIGKSVLVMGLLTHKSFGRRINSAKSIVRPSLISSYNLVQTSLRAIRSMVIAIALILLGVILLWVVWTMLISRWQ